MLEGNWSLGLAKAVAYEAALHETQWWKYDGDFAKGVARSVRSAAEEAKKEANAMQKRKREESARRWHGPNNNKKQKTTPN